MNNTRAAIKYLIILSIFSSGIFFSSCSKKSMNGMIIFTRVNLKQNDTANLPAGSVKYVPQSQLMALDAYEPAGSPAVITEGYFSARSPEISNDGRYLLFTAKQKQSDPWQIWEMDLSDKKIRRVISSQEDCIDPAYLPGRRLVFSQDNVNDKLRATNSLYTCNLDGTDIKRITFNPHSYLASTVLKDGRVLTISRLLYPVKGASQLIVLRPDGTKAELFYKSSGRNAGSMRPWETTDAKIVFIESGKDSLNGSSVISIDYNRPLQTRVNLSSGIKGDFHSAFPLSSGRLLVSWRPSENDRYALYEFDQEMKAPGRIIYQNKDFDVLEAVVVNNTYIPKKLPSEVDMEVKTGLLLCQDINVLNTLTVLTASSIPKASQIEVIGIDSSLGIIQVEKDGSFYLKVMADEPFRIRTLDDNGNALNNTCGWIWLRPNERRGCIGCHEDPYQVPENRMPLAVKNPPVSVPVHISQVKEKKVLLE